MDSVLEYIFRKLEDSDVNVIFDRYFEYSTKSATRTSRAVQQASRRHKLTPSTPLPAQTTALTTTKNKRQYNLSAAAGEREDPQYNSKT